MERIRERYYLSYPRALIREPILYQLVKKFDLVFNIRGASVSEDMGLVAVEFEGTNDQIERAINHRSTVVGQYILYSVRISDVEMCLAHYDDFAYPTRCG